VLPEHVAAEHRRGQPVGEQKVDHKDGPDQGITVLYLIGGAPLADDAAPRMTTLAHHTAIWWAIVVPSVATDLLFVPVMWSLYTLLKHANRNAMLAGTGVATGILGLATY
jgi:hypothetical protein